MDLEALQGSDVMLELLKEPRCQANADEGQDYRQCSEGQLNVPCAVVLFDLRVHGSHVDWKRGRYGGCCGRLLVDGEVRRVKSDKFERPSCLKRRSEKEC